MRSELAVVLLICYMAVPHPYCYYFSGVVETDTEVVMHFKKNDFFSSRCSETKNVFLESSKDVAVYLDGAFHRRFRNEDLCIGRSSRR